MTLTEAISHQNVKGHVTMANKADSGKDCITVEGLITSLPIPAGKRAKASMADRYDVTSLAGFTRALTMLWLTQGHSVGRRDVIAACPFTIASTASKAIVTHAIQQSERHHEAGAIPSPEGLQALAEGLTAVIEVAKDMQAKAADSEPAKPASTEQAS